MTGDKGNGPTLTATIRRVLEGDVDAYGTIYDIIDKPLRYYIRRTYGRFDDDFRNEVATRTHTFVFEHLAQYNPGYATLQTWAKRSSRNVALRVMTERFTLHKVETKKGKWERESISIALDEDALTLAAMPGPDSDEALWLKHVLCQEYSALAREGKLSLALHVVEGRPLHETAKLLNIPVIRLRRLLDRELRGLRKRLQRRGVAPSLRSTHFGMVSHADDTGYDDDWTSSMTAALPDDPDSTDDGTEEQIPEEVTED